MCLNDALAIGVIHELQRRGVRVPQDMQVIGFDNVPDAEYCMPGLTTIDRMWMITRDMPWIC